MDIHLAIEHLGLNGNRYGLDDANPPHKIIKWLGPDSQPTDSQLSDAWAEIQAAKPMKDWERKMAETDSGMPRIWEDFLTLNGTDGWPQITKDRHISKVALRATKPEA